MRVAACQLDSNADKEHNLESADRLTREAAAEGAELVVLPEKFSLLGSDFDYRRGSETLDGPTVQWARELARELRIDFIAGSFAEHRPGRNRLSNTCVHVAPSGEIQAVYRKIHMFDVTVAGLDYRESDVEEPGTEIVVSRTASGVEVGLAICYDVRFPEQFRILALHGALVIALPSNFTKPTGRAHWEVLLRARAIENQAFVIASAQAGIHPPDRESYGHSMIVDPWGEVLATTGEGEDTLVCDLDLERLAAIREQMPVLKNRMGHTYTWPAEVGA